MRNAAIHGRGLPPQVRHFLRVWMVGTYGEQQLAVSVDRRSAAHMLQLVRGCDALVGLLHRRQLGQCYSIEL
eukprot:SAG31_NODE_2906_length_4924_cov_4.748187_1_plen_72_part_00